MWKNYQNHLPQFALPLLFTKLFFFHLQTPLPTQLIPEKQTTSDPIKYHSRTTRQEGGVPSLPPRPPLISQSKYFSLFSNPDSCKNSSIIIILIIIYKNRSSFSFYFLSFSKCIFFPQAKRSSLWQQCYIYFFFHWMCHQESQPIPSLTPSPWTSWGKTSCFCSRYKTKTMLKIPLFFFFSFERSTS